MTVAHTQTQKDPHGPISEYLSGVELWANAAIAVFITDALSEHADFGHSLTDAQLPLALLKQAWTTFQNFKSSGSLTNPPKPSWQVQLNPGAMFGVEWQRPA